MRLLPLRTWLAAAAAGIGTGTALILAGLPPGQLHHRPLAPFAALLRPDGVRVGLLATVAWALGLLISTAWIRSGRRLSLPRAAGVVEPPALGATAGGLAPLLEPWWFESPSPVLLGAGIGLGAIVAWRRFAELPPPLDARAAERRTLAAVALLAVVAPAILVGPGPPEWHELSGDEPHYLVIARSLWTDGDVELGDDYRLASHALFFPGTLSPHTMAGHLQGTRYSVHGIGLGVWLAPWYGMGQELSTARFTLLVRLAMTLWLAAAAVVVYRLTAAVAGPGAGARGSALAVLTAPLLFAGPHLFPEVPALALSGGAWLLLRRRPGPGGALAAGILLAALPWLGYKFAGVAAVVGLAGVWRAFRPARGGDRRGGAGRVPHGRGTRGRRESHRERRLVAAAVAVPLVFSALGHVAFTWTLYRSVWPTAITTGAGAVERVAVFGDDPGALADPLAALRSGLGYLMDQREGLLVYAPQYLLATAGLAWMLRRRRVDLTVTAAALAALWVPYSVTGAIGGWSPPARPLTGILWTLAVPLGVALALPAGGGRAGRWRSTVRAALVTAGAGITALLAVQPDLLYHDHNTALSLPLRRYGAPGLPLWDWAPSWLAYDEPRWTVTLAWLVAVVVAGLWLARWGWQVGGQEPGDGRGAGAGPGSSDRRVASLGALAVLLTGSGALLAHHALLPVTALHHPSAYQDVEVWEPVSPPQRVWPNRRGIWIGGFDEAELRLSSREPLSSLTLRVQAAAAMRARLGVGNDQRTLDLDAGDETLARFDPGPGTRWAGRIFWPLWVQAPGGVSRRALGDPDDPGTLGLRLELVEAR